MYLEARDLKAHTPLLLALALSAWCMLAAKGQYIQCEGDRVYQCEAYNETYCQKTLGCDLYSSGSGCYNSTSSNDKEYAQCTDYKLEDECLVHGCIVSGVRPPPGATTPPPPPIAGVPSVSLGPAGPDACPFDNLQQVSQIAAQAVSGTFSAACATVSSNDPTTVYFKSGTAGTWCIAQSSSLFCFNATDFVTKTGLTASS